MRQSVGDGRMLRASTARSHVQDFAKLEVWRRALRLAVAIDRQSRCFPRNGYGWLTSQMRRAAASIGANIAEGCGQRSGREFSRFLQMAIASASEMQHHLAFAHGVGLISTRDFSALSGELTQLRRMLIALQNRVRESLATDDPVPTANDSQSH